MGQGTWETAAYYTFSTIAQTLAGALGLLAAFVVIRLSTLAQELRAEADQLYQHVGAHNEHTEAYLAGNYLLLVELYERGHAAAQKEKTQGLAQGKAPWPDLNSRQLGWLKHARSVLDTRSALTSAIIRAVGMSVWVICAAFAAVALSPLLSRSLPILWLSLAGMVASAGYCVVWYGRILRQSVDGR